MSSSKDKQPLARSLGQFFGHIWKGVTSDSTGPESQKQTLRHDVEEQTSETEQGKMTLRRTTIEEVEIEGAPNSPPADPIP